MARAFFYVTVRAFLKRFARTGMVTSTDALLCFDLFSFPPFNFLVVSLYTTCCSGPMLFERGINGFMFLNIRLLFP